MKRNIQIEIITPFLKNNLTNNKIEEDFCIKDFHLSLFNNIKYYIHFFLENFLIFNYFKEKFFIIFFFILIFCVFIYLYENKIFLSKNKL
jgi:hypothetical protein